MLIMVLMPVIFSPVLGDFNDAHVCICGGGSGCNAIFKPDWIGIYVKLLYNYTNCMIDIFANNLINNNGTFLVKTPELTDAPKLYTGRGIQQMRGFIFK